MNDTRQANDLSLGLERVAQAAQESLTDSMVERLGTGAANLLEVLDRLNDEDTRAAVLHLIDRLTEMHRTGALDTAFQLLSLLHGARNALTDSMVERLFAFTEHMVNNLANEEVADLARHTHRAMSQAASESETQKASGGLLATLSLLGKPESQQSLQFLLAFASRMRRFSAMEEHG